MTMAGDVQQKLTEDEKKIENIIRNSNLSDDEKEILCLLSERLVSYGKEHYNCIQDKVEKELELELADYDEDFCVKTVLVDSERAEQLFNRGHFDYVIDKKKVLFGAFFDCSYKKFKEICSSKTYTARVVSRGKTHYKECVFRANYKFVEREKIVFRAAEQYKSKRPVIYSPYARKFAMINFTDKEFDTSTITEITIDDIPEEMKLTNEYYLMWNVSVKQKNLDSTESMLPSAAVRKKTPFFDTLKYKMCYITNPKDMILFDFENNVDFELIREENNVYVSSDTDLHNLKYQILTFLDGAAENDIITFENYYRRSFFPVRRARTYADILNIIYSFNDNPFDIHISENPEICHKNSNEDIKYDSDCAYYPPVRKSQIRDYCKRTIPKKSSLNCILTFSGGFMTEDYAYYVVEYLNEYYPEIKWLGRVE